MRRMGQALKTVGGWPRRLGNEGVSLLELVAAVAVLALLVGLAAPNFLTMMSRSQVDAASRQLLSDVRRARSLAITQGWEYKVLGFNAEADSPFANQYRILARSPGQLWPDETAAPFQNATQIAGPWINVNNEYPGARINPGDLDGTVQFWVAFNARGVRIESDGFNPLFISDGSGSVQRAMAVSLPGVVTIQ